MTLAQDAERNRLALIDQLYDHWGGYYILRRLIDGHWCDVRALDKDQAIAQRLAGDEALLIVPERNDELVQMVLLEQWHDRM